MRIIVSDTSCLIDLRKGGLLHLTFLLPFAFQIALPLIHSELLDFTQIEIDDLIARGLSVIDLSPEEVGHSLTVQSAHPILSFNDCASMVLSTRQADSILITGDRNLRNQAAAIGIEVHGILWITDQLEACGLTPDETILQALIILESDPFVFLPEEELGARISRLRKP